MCLSNNLTSLSAALGRRTHLAVELHTAAGRVTGSPQRAQHSGWPGTEETNNTAKTESEFTNALPVSGLMNSSHAVTSERAGKTDKMECKSEDMK